MSLAIGRSEPELCWFLIPSEEAIAAESHRRYVMMERKAAVRRSAPHRKGAMHGEQKRQRAGTSRGQGSAPGYFSVELAMVFLFVAASLVFLPLVLPPLSSPPFLLLLVPVGLLAVLAALAFVPLDAQSNLVGSSRL